MSGPRLSPQEFERLLAAGMYHGRPQQMRQVMEDLASRDGKLTKESVRYRDADGGSNRRCGTCDMYRTDVSTGAGGSCSLVEGSISPQAVCDRYEPKGS